MNTLLYLIIALAPLAGALSAGLLGWALGRRLTHWLTILGVAISASLSLKVLCGFIAGEAQVFDQAVYTWLTVNGQSYSVGFLVDSLSALMMVVVTTVSLMVHIYTIGYMRDDPGYPRFFSYISLFTFAMLMLVMSNNFIQLFFGWEAVGLVSYLLIGFWFKRPSAIFANLKAFLVNRVGDLGFLLGIGLLFAYCGELHYSQVFAAAPTLAQQSIELITGYSWPLMALICTLLFIGAMGKSAQFPLHVWLPDSMEGPTPISALIHAATMVTAGIFMVARLSPLFELSDFALNFIMIIGAITALFMGFLGVVQNDIKRVIAYSTLSQLGYMTVALGASAYSAAVFHVMTHAFFKALLFLAAGSVIIAMHHEQDMRKMGGLRKTMPLTWITSLIGSLALIGTPFFSGFYSKDSIIEAVAHSNLPAASFAYFAVTASVFITALYSFRLYFLVFHGQERWKIPSTQPHHSDDEHHGLKPHQNPHESPWVITLPLFALAIPSALIGFFAITPLLYGDFFKGAIYIDSLHELGKSFDGPLNMALHALSALPFWLTVLGVFVAWLAYLKSPTLPASLQKKMRVLYRCLVNKYYLDELYFAVFAQGARALGSFLWKIGDIFLIDGLIVNGSAAMVAAFSRIIRRLQTGFIYSYAMTMIVGLLFFMTYWFSPLLLR